MNDFLIVLAFAALPAAGNFAGGLAAEILDISDRVLSLALHLAAGIVLAVVGLELVPQALEGNPPWIPIAAFIAGGAVFIGLEHLIDAVKDRLATGEESTGPLAIFTGVSLDLFSDGIMIGTGSVINPALGLLLAAGQVPATSPKASPPPPPSNAPASHGAPAYSWPPASPYPSSSEPASATSRCAKPPKS